MAASNSAPEVHRVDPDTYEILLAIASLKRLQTQLTVTLDPWTIRRFFKRAAIGEGPTRL